MLGKSWIQPFRFRSRSWHPGTPPSAFLLRSAPRQRRTNDLRTGMDAAVGNLAPGDGIVHDRLEMPGKFGGRPSGSPAKRLQILFLEPAQFADQNLPRMRENKRVQPVFDARFLPPSIGRKAKRSADLNRKVFPGRREEKSRPFEGVILFETTRSSLGRTRSPFELTRSPVDLMQSSFGPTQSSFGTAQSSLRAARSFLGTARFSFRPIQSSLGRVRFSSRRCCHAASSA